MQIASQSNAVSPSPENVSQSVGAPAVVYVVDDDRSVCASIRRVLLAAGHHVRTFSGTKQLFGQGRPAGPCCLVLDVQLCGENGLTFQDELASAGITVPIIFLTAHGDVSMSVRAMKSGAADFLTKPFEVPQLLRAVDQALAKDGAGILRARHVADVRRRYEALTPREREVFAMVTAGLLNKQIAYDLEIAEKTIKVHRGRVMEKMNAGAIVHLVRMADLLGVCYTVAN